MSEEHRHKFKVRYKFVNGQRIAIDPVCQCSGCEVKAMIKVDVDRVMVIFVGSGTQVSYEATLYQGE